MKTHDLYGTTVNYKTVQYFFEREKNDINGNARYRVYIISPVGIVYVKIFKCYEIEIEDRVISFVKREANF